MPLLWPPTPVAIRTDTRIASVLPGPMFVGDTERGGNCALYRVVEPVASARDAVQLAAAQDHAGLEHFRQQIEVRPDIVAPLQPSQILAGLTAVNVPPSETV